MARVSKSEREEALARLREWIKPGDTVYTILDHVSRSGMSRDIRVVLLKCEEGTARDLHPNWAVGKVLGLSHARKNGRELDALRVGGCGMDMGFHIVHNLGYAMFGEQAEKGEGPEANALREAIYNADRFYYHQGGKHDAPPPDFTKPDKWWFGAAGYAIKHRWL